MCDTRGLLFSHTPNLIFQSELSHDYFVTKKVVAKKSKKWYMYFGWCNIYDTCLSSFWPCWIPFCGQNECVIKIGQKKNRKIVFCLKTVSNIRVPIFLPSEFNFTVKITLPSLVRWKSG